MGLLKKSLLASVAVQLTLPIIYLAISSLPLEYEQSAIVLLFPFVVGIQFGPILMRPLAGTLSPEGQLTIAMVSLFAGNFIVYAVLFHLWFTLRDKFYTSKSFPAMG